MGLPRPPRGLPGRTKVAPAAPLPEGSPAREKHLYSAAKVNRVVVMHVVGAVGGLIITALVLLVPKLGADISAWGGVLAGVVFSYVIFMLYDRCMWRWSVVECLPGTTVADMRGTWTGQLVVRASPEDGEIGQELGCTVRIEQDWSRIQVRLTTDETESYSLMAAIDGRGLRYEYYVVPLSDEAGEVLGLLKPHYGMADLKLTGDSMLGGEWFNDQDFQRWGSIELKR